MLVDLVPWAGFLALVGALLALDLGVFHRDAHEPSRREALAWTGVWLGVATMFGAGVFLFAGRTSGIEWTTGYLIEKSLAVDNIFIFLLIFQTFAVPPALQHRVLFWGILGAILMRALLIGVAGFLLGTLHWMAYVFGAFLVVTGVRFLRDSGHTPDLARNPFIRLLRRVMHVTETYEGQRFVVRRDGVLLATPLLLVLVLVEVSDLVFAVDSIPAIYAITDDPFIVFTSNILAILGLRAMYFVLAGYLGGFVYLKPALAAILVFVGAKMLLTDVVKIDALVSLAVIVSILGTGIAASATRARRKARPAPGTAGAEAPHRQVAPGEEPWPGPRT